MRDECAQRSTVRPLEGSYSLHSPFGPHSVRYSAALRSYSGFVEKLENRGLFPFLIQSLVATATISDPGKAGYGHCR